MQAADKELMAQVMGFAELQDRVVQQVAISADGRKEENGFMLAVEADGTASTWATIGDQRVKLTTPISPPSSLRHLRRRGYGGQEGFLLR